MVIIQAGRHHTFAVIMLSGQVLIMSNRHISGRTIIYCGSHELTEAFADRLNTAGIDAAVYHESDSDDFCIAVDPAAEKKAEKLLDSYMEELLHHEELVNNWRADFLTGSPAFVRAEDKFKDSTDSAHVFLTAGLVMLGFVVARSVTRDHPFRFMEYLPGLIFLLFGLYTRKKAKQIREQVVQENDFTNKILATLLSDYSAEGLDRMAGIDTNSLSAEECFFQRTEVIRSYILREYTIDDEAYLEYLVETAYEKLYEQEAISD